MKNANPLLNLPKLAQPVRTTDPRPGLVLRTGLRAGNRLFDSQNQHYLSAETSLDV